MSGYTKGPWKFIDVLGGCSIHAGSRTLLEYRHSPSEENISNARLMSASPDLLEALQDLVDDVSERFDLHSPSTNPGIKHCIKNAREAIAKARGEK